MDSGTGADLVGGGLTVVASVDSHSDSKVRLAKLTQQVRSTSTAWSYFKTRPRAGPMAWSIVYAAARPQTRQRLPTSAAVPNQPAGSFAAARSSSVASKARIRSSVGGSTRSGSPNSGPTWQRSIPPI